MLVLDIVDEAKSDVVFQKRRKKKHFQPIRDNICIKNRLYNVVHMTRANIDDSSVRRIIELNRGRVLKCKCNEINSKIYEYLLDVRPYIKRAILSSLINEMKYNFDVESLCILDSDFTVSEEIFDLAKRLRKLSIIGDNTNAIECFRDKCYRNFGLRVDNSNDYADFYQVKLDLNDIVMNKSAFLTIDGCKMLVYADESYFELDENSSQLLKYNIPIEYICASLNK